MKYPTLTYSGSAGGLRRLRSMIVISGDSEALIENCRRIIECSEVMCSVESSGCVIEIWGAGLSLTSYANGSAGVSGSIRSLQISRKGRGGG